MSSLSPSLTSFPLSLYLPSLSLSLHSLSLFSLSLSLFSLLSYLSPLSLSLTYLSISSLPYSGDLIVMHQQQHSMPKAHCGLLVKGYSLISAGTASA